MRWAVFVASNFSASTERSHVGNLVGIYDDLAELMALAREGTVTLHTQQYALDDAVQAMQNLHDGTLHGRGILLSGG